MTVRLKMVARDYVAGATEAERMTKRLAGAQRDLAGSSRTAGDELDRTARRMEASGKRSGRALQYTAAGVAALGAAGGALKVLPGLMAATATAGGALPPMLLGAAAAGGVLKFSLNGVGDAAKELLKTDDPLAGLSKSARATVFEMKALQPVMVGVQQGLQDRVFKNAAQDLNILATQVLPQVRGGLNELATDWGDTFDQMTAAVADPQFIDGFNSATAGADWFFDLLNNRIPVTVRSLSTLVTSADPLARAFGQGLVNALDQFNGAVDRAARSGSLEAFFARGAKGAGDFMAITQGVFRIVGLVTNEVAKQNGTLGDTRAALEAYLASGRGAADVAGIVNTLTTAYEGLGDVLGPLGGIARDALADPATADALRTMFDVLAAGSQVLQVVFGLFQGLPNVVQSTVLVLIAGALVAGKLTKALALVQGSADRAATSLGKTGAAGTRAGRGLQVAASGAGKAATALVGLQVLGAVLDQFTAAAPNVEALGRALEVFAAKGQVTGELTRLFGKDLEGLDKAARFAADGRFDKFARDTEGTIAPIRSLGELINGESFTGGAEKMKALDAELTQYAKTTGDVKGAQDLWNRAFEASGLEMTDFAKLLPSSTAELQRLREANETGAAGMQTNREAAKLLAGSFAEAALAGKDLANTMDIINGKNTGALEGQIRLEEAYDNAQETVEKYGRVTKKGTHEIDKGTKAGRESLTTLIAYKDAAVAAAQAEADRTGNTEAGIPILNSARANFIAMATVMTGSAAAATALANEIFKIPNKDVKVDAKTEAAVAKLKDMGIEIGKLPNGKSVLYAAKTEEGRRKLREAGFELKKLPNGKWVVVGAKTEEARKKLREAQNLIDRVHGKTVTLTVVRKTLTRDGERVTGGTGSGTQVRARGGVSVPYGRPIAAAMGLVRPDIYPASDPPLYQFAEKETGGELFLPRKGIDRERGRALLAIGASWYGGMFMPMRRGGVRVQAAASGLVNVAPAPQSTSGSTPGLDYHEAYLRATNAVAALNAAIKENGRSFSTATAKGRENRSALYSMIRAAQDAAKAKFDETGSVKAANAVYDTHIARLRATLKQQKVNAKEINALLALAERPSFTTPPANSLANISFAKADIGVRGGLGDLGDALSLNRAGVDLSTEHGRDNLTAIINYLEQAGAAAQARFEQTKNVKTATSYYDGLVAQFRGVLANAGYSAATINSILAQYGKITLQPNARGGVYMAAAGGIGMLGQAAIYQQPAYGFAEKRTGGELFVPRLGDQTRGERLLAIGAGWYGGRYTPAGNAQSATPATVNNNLTVNSGGDRMTVGELQGLQRQMDARARIGRKG